MKAIRIHEFGVTDKVQLEEIAVPEVTQGTALVRIRAAGVNPVDWMVREHIYNPKGADRVPLTLGQDFAGVIEKIGPGSRTPLREGDEVFGEVFGSFAEYALVPLRDLVRKPAGLSGSTPSSTTGTSASRSTCATSTWCSIRSAARPRGARGACSSAAGC